MNPPSADAAVNPHAPAQLRSHAPAMAASERSPGRGTLVSTRRCSAVIRLGGPQAYGASTSTALNATAVVSVSVSAGTEDFDDVVAPLVGLGEDELAGVTAAERSAGDHESATAARTGRNRAAAPTAVICCPSATSPT